VCVCVFVFVTSHMESIDIASEHKSTRVQERGTLSLTLSLSLSIYICNAAEIVVSIISQFVYIYSYPIHHHSIMTSERRAADAAAAAAASARPLRRVRLIAASPFSSIDPATARQTLGELDGDVIE